MQLRQRGEGNRPEAERQRGRILLIDPDYYRYTQSGAMKSDGLELLSSSDDVDISVIRSSDGQKSKVGLRIIKSTVVSRHGIV